MSGRGGDGGGWEAGSAVCVRGVVAVAVVVSTAPVLVGSVAGTVNTSEFAAGPAVRPLPQPATANPVTATAMTTPRRSGLAFLLRAGLGSATMSVLGSRAALVLVVTGLLLGLSSCGSNSTKSTAGGSIAKVQITAPADGSVVRSDRVTIRGTVTPPDATVQIVGQSAQVGNGVFTGSVALKPGSNTIDVTASAPGATPATTTITLKRPSGSSGSATTTPRPVPSSPNVGPPPLSGPSDCGGGLTAGANTSCPFARNVQDAFNRFGGGLIDVFSPTTGQTYRVFCTSSSPHVCTGGNNASVYFGDSSGYSTSGCGDGLVVGPTTSCGFAENVRAEYQRSGATINRYLATLSHMLNVAKKEWRLIERNPVSDIAKKKEGRGRTRFLSDAERTKLLAVCESSAWPQLHTLVVLAITTGARRGELITLKWDAIDLKAGKAIVTETKNGEPRTLPLVGKALEALRALKLQGSAASPYVFPNPSGFPGYFDHFDHRWRDALTAAELEGFRFHDLRHCCASYLAANGASLLEIADVLGHKTLAMVRRYSHLTQSHKASVIERMVKAQGL